MPKPTPKLRLKFTDQEKLIMGERLAATRIALGWARQEDMADALKVNRSTLNEWERGAKVINLRFATALCEQYGVTMDWLYRGRPADLPHSLREKLISDRHVA